MKKSVSNRVLALILGIMFSHIACAQQADNAENTFGTDWAVYDEYDAAALQSYLETGYCPHELSVWAAGGVSSLQLRPSSGKANSGFGGAFGAGYTYFLNRNWGLSSGLEYAFYQDKITLNGFAGANATFDILNNPIVYNTRIDRYHEKQFAGLLNIPLSVQYQAGSNHRFYASAGLKFGLPVYAKYSGSHSTLTASGYYPDYNQTEVWQNDLGYGVFNLNENSGKPDLGISIMGALETGVKWNTGTGRALYTGIFMDYGFNSILNGGYSKKPLVEYNRIAPEYPVMNTSCVLAGRFSPMAFGVKVKLAFSVGCSDWLNGREAYKSLRSAAEQEDKE
jgi:hypothetical protein